MADLSWLNSFAFDPTTTQYSGKNSLALAKMSWLSYFPEKDIKATLKRWNFIHFRFFNLGIVQAFLAADSEKIILAFRGSDSAKDWLGNLDIDLVGGPFGGKVHEGFLNALSPVWKDIQLTISALKPRNAIGSTQIRQSQGNITSVNAPSLWLTGHSLGGALATLAAAKLREKDQPLHGLYTFGSPRIGDRVFADRFNADFRTKMFRAVNKNDLVTRVPIRAIFYSHVGQLLYFDEADNLHTDPSFWYRFLDGIKVRLEDIADLDLSTLESHKIANYLKVIEQNKDKALADAQ